MLEQCDDGEAAFHTWMERDAEFARWLTTEVKAPGLELLRVDGKQTIEENASAVASHFRLAADLPRI